MLIGDRISPADEKKEESVRRSPSSDLITGRREKKSLVIDDVERSFEMYREVHLLVDRVQLT